MTISTTIIKSSLNGNGSTSAFTYSFKITDDDDIQVIIRSATGTETVKSKGTHYNVSGVGNNSGTVTFTSGNIPASGETVVLRRSTPKTQAMDLIDNDPMSADTIETAHDKVISITQELQEQLDRSLKLSRTNTMTSTEFTTSATDRASKILAFDSSGELSIAQELGNVKGNWAASTAYVQRDIVKDTSTNNIFIALTAHTSSGSQPLTSNTDSAKWSLLVDAASATTSATAAASSATAAASSASTASTQASNASTSASTASTKATEAASSATAAASSATSAAASFDAFDDIYLGAKSSDPSTDNDGDALTTGDQYFNTSSNQLKIYNGSAWQVAAISTSGLATLVGAETLTNKTLTAPVLSGSASSAGTILFKEDTDNGTNAVTLKGAAATADVTLTLPAATDTLVGKNTTDTLTNKTINASQLVDASIATGKIADDAVTNAKLAANAVDTSQIITDAVTTGKIADNAITLAKMAGGTDGNIISFDASGNPVAVATGNDGQVLTSTGAGSPPAFEDAGGGGDNTPNFFARSTADQSLSAGSWTKVTFGTEDYDSDNAFASSKFTVPNGEGGLYFLHASVFVGASSETSLSQQFTAFYKNGSIFRTDVSDFRGVRTHQYTATVSAILDLSATDYIEVYVQSSATSTLTLDSSAGKGVERLTTFQGFKLIT
tara:strand:+ start:1646 stop:3655 length:2010 start_codon:yes stop_codon:yes gene_type:complete